DLRLTERAAELGLVDDFRLEHTRRKAALLVELKTVLAGISHDGVRLELWLKRPENTWPQLPQELRAKFDAELWDIAQNDIKYAGYISRQENTVDKSAKMEHQ